MARERVEIFAQGSVCVIDNFRVTRFFGSHHPRAVRTWRQDRGHHRELFSWIQALRRGDPAPVAFGEYVAATLATFALAEGVREGHPIQVDLSLLTNCHKEGEGTST